MMMMVMNYKPFNLSAYILQLFDMFGIQGEERIVEEKIYGMY